MCFDCSWCEDVGLEDLNGCIFWVFGVMVCDVWMVKYCDWVMVMFDLIVSFVFEFGLLCVQVFVMFGVVVMLEVSFGYQLLCLIFVKFFDVYFVMFVEVCCLEWQWFEIVLVYDNVCLFQVLICVGQVFGCQDLIDCGLLMFDWIVVKQILFEGCFCVVGIESFSCFYVELLQFDQQLLEVQVIVDVCVVVYDVIGDVCWKDEVECVYCWFFGVNDFNLLLVSVVDGGCFDGLMLIGLNWNQGVELILVL